MSTGKLSTGVFLNAILDIRFLLKLNVLLKEYLVTLYSCKINKAINIIFPVWQRKNHIYCPSRIIVAATIKQATITNA